MAFLKRKYETPHHYKPLSKRGQKGIASTILILIVTTLLYIISFYII
ncbi:MAG: hypothetical protein ACPGSO_04750 [Vicingaceae bacterium]